MPDTRTDASVQAMQHNARIQQNAEVGVVFAAAGATQGDATYTHENEIIIVTATASSQGIRLSPAVAGAKRTVVAMSNRGVKVYPSTGDRLTGAAANAAVSVPLNRIYTFIAVDADVWRIQRGAAS